MINLKENCKELKAKFQQQYTSVTEEDLSCNDGGPGEMVERLQQRLEKTSEELHQIISNL